MNVPVFVTALLGGMAIGAASVLMMFLIGRIAGISGITFNAITKPVAQSWSVMFLLGLLLGTALYHLASGAPIPVLGSMREARIEAALKGARTTLPRPLWFALLEAMRQTAVP